MPIIPAQPHVEQKDTLSLRLEHEVHERLKQYAEFIQSPKDYVIGQALRRLFRKDKDFAAWAESRAIGTAHDAGSPSGNVTPQAAVNATLPSTVTGSRARVEKSA
jgi:predicted transcriptional regulator